MANADPEPQTPAPGAETPVAEPSSAERDAAAGWEASLEAEGGDANGGGAQQTLSQEEIDRLIGGENASAREKTGIEALLNSTGVSYERLPLLEIVFDRLARLLTASLRSFFSENVNVSLDSVSSIRFGDYMNSVPLPAILAIFRAEELNNCGLITVDSSLIYSTVDVLLGGARATASIRIEGRPYTTIERCLIQEMIGTILADLREAFEPVAPINFVYDRTETDPRFATISRPSNAAVLTKLRIEMGDRGGNIELLLPYATLEPIRETLLQTFMGEKFGRDSIWERHLATELWRTNVEVEAVLDEVRMPLKDVMNMKVGQTLLLSVGPQSAVKIRCGEAELLTGMMGRVGTSVAVSINARVRKQT